MGQTRIFAPLAMTAAMIFCCSPNWALFFTLASNTALSLNQTVKGCPRSICAFAKPRAIRER